MAWKLTPFPGPHSICCLQYKILYCKWQMLKKVLHVYMAVVLFSFLWQLESLRYLWGSPSTIAAANSLRLLLPKIWEIHHCPFHSNEKKIASGAIYHLPQTCQSDVQCRKWHHTVIITIVAICSAAVQQCTKSNVKPVFITATVIYTAVYNHWTGLVDWTGGLDWRTDIKKHFYNF